MIRDNLSIMKLWFRKLQAGDVPAVRDMTRDVWDGNDYLPAVIERWLGHPEFYTFGAFTDKETSELVGTGQVRWLLPGVAWVEGGRVHPRVQKQGIGMELARHAIEHARLHGARSILYDTSTRNQGSRAIGMNLGFKEIERLRISVLLAGEIDDKTTFSVGVGTAGRQMEAIAPGDALSFLESRGFSTGTYVCTGWAFIPFDRDAMEALPWPWYRLGSTIGLVITTKAGALYEGARKNETWFVLYGEENDARELTRQLVIMAKSNPAIDTFSVFCPEHLAPAVEQLGFHPWEDNPVWATLLELRFHRNE